MPLLRSQRCLIPTDREWFVNERGVASLSHPITIRRRYRGFTSLWPRRDSKVSTPLLRTRQNGLCSRPVFRISSLTAPLASSCLLARNRGSLSMIKRDRSLNLSFTLVLPKFLSSIEENRSGNARAEIDRPCCRFESRSSAEGEAIDFASIGSESWRESWIRVVKRVRWVVEVLRGEGDSSPSRGLEDFASSPPWRIAIGGC